MTIEVHSGIMMPAARGKQGKYPWDKMEVKQSFFVQKKYKFIPVPVRLRKNGRKFRQIIRPEINGAVYDGLGVWRVA